MHNAKNFLIRSLVISVFETNGRLVEAGNELVARLGLTAAWWQVLGALGYSTEPLPVAHIARNMGLSRQSVQRVVDLLFERGLVSFENNPHHQRAKLVVLTATGHAALQAAEAAVAPLDRQMLERIGAERVAVATEVLKEITDMISHTFDRPATAKASNAPSRKDAA